MLVAVPQLFPIHKILLPISWSSPIHFFTPPNLSHTLIYFTLNYITNDWPACRRYSLSILLFFCITQKKEKNEVERNSTIHFLFLSLVHLYCRFYYVFALMSGQCTQKRMTAYRTLVSLWRVIKYNHWKKERKRKKNPRRTKCAQETTTAVDELSICAWVRVHRRLDRPLF